MSLRRRWNHYNGERLDGFQVQDGEMRGRSGGHQCKRLVARGLTIREGDLTLRFARHDTSEVILPRERIKQAGWPTLVTAQIKNSQDPAPDGEVVLPFLPKEGGVRIGLHIAHGDKMCRIAVRWKDGFTLFSGYYRIDGIPQVISLK